MRIDNEKGIALVITMFVMVILLGLGSIFVLRSVQENIMTKKNLELTKSFYIAEGGSHAALDSLDTLINTHLFNTVSSTNPSVLISNAQSYVNNADGLGLLVNYVKESGSQLLTLNGSQAEYSKVQNFGSGSYQYKIIITQKSPPALASSDSWDFDYLYKIESNGYDGGLDQSIDLFGDFTVNVKRDNFAKYALFTNQQTLPSGTKVWFTNRTNFAGPLHTNGRYNIALNPSATFESLVQQKEQKTRYYNNGWTVLKNDDHNGTRDVPTFNAGFNRNVPEIILSSPIQQQDMIDQAKGGQSLSGYGIYIPNDGSNVVGGIYVYGNGDINLSVDSYDKATYTINQGSLTKIVTVDKTNSLTTVEVPGYSSTVYNGIPDGIDDVGTIIYVDGQITSLSGTVQKDTQLTISSKSDIVITDNLKYANYTPAIGSPGTSGYVPPNAEGADNLLGVVTWEGDVRIGTCAPNDVEIHGTLLAKEGIYQVDNYNDQSAGPRGTATLMGGVITNYYGAFGLFSGRTGNQLSGYGRNFVYDERMQTGSAPPYYPTLSSFVAFSNNLFDKVVWKGN